mmetsp:Transcript_40937/g.130855  ORF Transcript_40937/g.130855 Transcript_40937/m.130855 type:complete len:299 (-) Transcript_40937:357-1253(-)
MLQRIMPRSDPRNPPSLGIRHEFGVGQPQQRLHELVAVEAELGVLVGPLVLFVHEVGAVEDVVHVAALHQLGALIDDPKVLVHQRPAVEGERESVARPAPQAEPLVDLADGRPHLLEGILKETPVLGELVFRLGPELTVHELAALLLAQHVLPDALEHRHVRVGSLVEALAVGLHVLARREHRVVEVEGLLRRLGFVSVPSRPHDLQVLAGHEDIGLLHIDLDGVLCEVGVDVRVDHTEGDHVGVGRQHWDGDVALALCPGVRMRLGELGPSAVGQGAQEEEARGVHEPRLGWGKHGD